MNVTGSTEAHADQTHRANPLGAYITTLGAIITLVAVWLDWVTTGPGDSEGNASSGYEADSLVPFIGYLGIAFAVALLYAIVRADRRQHRGLSLASMAAGLASFLWVLSFLLDPIETVKYQENVSTEVGVWIALIGTLLWALGSLLLAREPEGDIESVRTTATTAVTRRDTLTSHRSTTDKHVQGQDAETVARRPSNEKGTQSSTSLYGGADVDPDKGTGAADYRR